MLHKSATFAVDI